MELFAGPRDWPITSGNTTYGCLSCSSPTYDHRPNAFAMLRGPGSEIWGNGIGHGPGHSSHISCGHHHQAPLKSLMGSPGSKSIPVGGYSRRQTPPDSEPRPRFWGCPRPPAMWDAASHWQTWGRGGESGMVRVGSRDTRERLLCGLSRAAALDAARTAGIEAVRVFEIAGGSYTTDLRPLRLDLLIEDDVVIAAGFF